MLRPGTLLDGKYRILREIGRGGMSIVYLALNERANKTWAVKEIRRDKASECRLLQSGIPAEIEMLKKLHHPYLAEIVDVIAEGDALLIVMDYVQGRDLQKILDEKKAEGTELNPAMDPEEVRAWAIQLCDVLEYLHSRNPPVIYRDLKPANIMIQEDPSGREPYGTVCLIDFGTAREVKARGEGDTVSLGTRGYAAPEQFGGQGESDARTDIFNLGATLYHLLTGFSPARTDYMFLPLGELREELRDSGMEKIVAKCCEAARENRYQSAAELREDLEKEPMMSEAAIRRYSIRWRCFLLALSTAVLAGISSILFGCAGLKTRNIAYEACIQKAESAESVREGGDAWLKAVCLNPGKPLAYQRLLSAIEADNTVSVQERKIMEDCLNSVSQGYSLQNAEELRRAAPADFDRLMYRIGTDYFFFYENGDGYRYAAQKLGSVRRTANLDRDRGEPSICGSLLMIADFIMKQRQASAEESWISDSNAAEIWDGLQAYISSPSEAVTRCGTRRIAAAMYRELSRRIIRDAGVFLDAGIGTDQMKAALSAARKFLNICRAENLETEYDKKLLAETEQSIEAADFRVRQLLNKADRRGT